MIDLNNCKPGDKLLSVHGMVLTYIRKLPEGSYYDHEVEYPNGSRGTRINDGHVYRNVDKRLPIDHDIIQILD